MVLLQKLALGEKKTHTTQKTTYLNTELPYDPVIQLLDRYPPPPPPTKEKPQKARTRTPMLLFTMAERYPSVDEWINSMWYTNNEILFCLKKE